jgi:ketosteroid isomerase-like protein
MKNKTKVLSSFALISIICLAFSSCSQKPVDVTGKINEANQTIMAAYESGNLNAITSCYTADAKMYPENIASIDGPQAIGAFFTAVRSMGIKKVRFEAVTALSYGDIAVEEGKYTLLVDGDHIADQGKYIVTWKNEEGKWKVHRDIWNTNNPAPQKRASLNDTVMVVWNTVKADKVSQFEEFNANYLQPAAMEFNGQVFKTARMLRPIEPNKDGTFTYFYIMDPAISLNAYEMAPPLKAKFGDEKAAEYLKMYSDCVIDKQTGAAVTVQTTE